MIGIADEGAMSRLAIEKAKQIHQRHLELAFPVKMMSLAGTLGCECFIWPFLESIKEVKQGRWIGIDDKLCCRKHFSEYLRI